MMLLLSFTVFFHRCIDDRHFFKKIATCIWKESSVCDLYSHHRATLPLVQLKYFPKCLQIIFFALG